MDTLANLNFISVNKKKSSKKVKTFPFYRDDTENVKIDKAVTTKGGTSTNEALGINGVIDTRIGQDYSSNCDMVSGIISLNSSEEGRQIIRDAIIANDDGTVTVNFAGIDVSYTFTADYIKAHDPDNGQEKFYTHGDNDALVLELAVAELRTDIGNGNVKVPQRYSDHKSSGGDKLYGADSDDLIYFLTGKERTDNEIVVSDKKRLEEMLTNAAASPSVITFGLYATGGTKSCKLDGGGTFSISNTQHALAITSIDVANKKVTFVNPWNSNKTYTATWDDFFAMDITQLKYTKL